MNKNYNDTCGGSEHTYLNTGAKDQCLEAVTVLLILAKDSFRFDSITDFKSKVKWDEAIKSRDLVPLFELYELANANTEETYYESRNFKKRTGKAMKVVTAEAYLSLCSDAALRSYANTEYNRLFEITEDGDIIGVFDTDGIKIKGQKIKDFTVGIRENATTAKPATTSITITYSDYMELVDSSIISQPSFDPVLDLYGIFNANFLVLPSPAPAATGFKFTVNVGCKSEKYMTEITSLKFNDTSGADQNATFTFDSATGIYTAAGTSLVTGELTTDGVQQDAVTGDSYEGKTDVIIP